MDMNLKLIEEKDAKLKLSSRPELIVYKLPELGSTVNDSIMSSSEIGSGSKELKEGFS